MSNVQSKSKTPSRLTANTKSRAAQKENVKRISFIKQKKSAQLDANKRRNDKAQRDRSSVIQDIYVQEKWGRAQRGSATTKETTVQSKRGYLECNPTVEVSKGGYPECNPSVERVADFPKRVNPGYQQQSAGSNPKMMSARARREENIRTRTEGAGVAVLMFAAAMAASHHATQRNAPAEVANRAARLQQLPRTRARQTVSIQAHH